MSGRVEEGRNEWGLGTGSERGGSATEEACGAWHWMLARDEAARGARHWIVARDASDHHLLWMVAGC